MDSKLVVHGKRNDIDVGGAKSLNCRVRAGNPNAYAGSSRFRNVVVFPGTTAESSEARGRRWRLRARSRPKKANQTGRTLPCRWENRSRLRAEAGHAHHRFDCSVLQLLPQPGWKGRPPTPRDAQPVGQSRISHIGIRTAAEECGPKQPPTRWVRPGREGKDIPRAANIGPSGLRSLRSPASARVPLSPNRRPRLRSSEVFQSTALSAPRSHGHRPCSTSRSGRISPLTTLAADCVFHTTCRIDRRG